MDIKPCAIITGASRGIGRAIALKLSAQYPVVINYQKNATAAQNVVDEIEAAGGTALCVQADVSDFNQAEQLVKTALDAFGAIHVVVNNAGITKDGLIMRMSEADFDAVMTVNLKGAYNLIRHASSPMMRQRAGRMINIASVIGLIGNAGQANYAASKAGLIGLTKSVARELAPRGITVNAVAPGYIDTDMTDALPDAVREKLKQLIPLGRTGKPEEIADAVAFLASDKAAYITGQVLVVDGGMAM